jgi:hypothetical protein
LHSCFYDSIQQKVTVDDEVLYIIVHCDLLLDRIVETGMQLLCSSLRWTSEFFVFMNRVILPGANRISRRKVDDAKQRFRDRSAAKLGRSPDPTPHRRQTVEEQSEEAICIVRLVKKCFSVWTLYERSLKAVPAPTGS